MPVNYDRSIAEAFQLLSPRKEDRIADFGCGNGRLLLHARQWLKNGGTLEGFDIDESGIERADVRAQRLGLNDQVSFQRANLCQMDELKLTPFDGGIAHFSIYTIREKGDRIKALQQMAQLIKPGGRLIVSVPSERYRIATIIAGAKKMESERTDIHRLIRTVRKNILYRVTEKAMMQIEKALDSGLFHRFTSEELSSNLKSAGLQPIKIQSSYADCGYHAVATKQ